MANSSNLLMSREFVILSLLLVLVAGGWLFWQSPSDAKAVVPTKNAEVIRVWPNSAGKRIEVGDEYDTTTVTGDLIAGERVQRITNVAEASLHFCPADAANNTGTTVIVCPGGGFHILAWDLEGTEIATWLNSIGVNAFILKYRVPTHKESDPSAAPTEDLQRAIALVRHNAEKWNLDADRVGVLGFSAGGMVTVNAALTTSRYDAIDEIDEQSARPNFIIPVYGARMVKKEGGLRDGMRLTKSSPTAFIVHAFDDYCPVHNALELSRLYKEADVPVDCHVFDSGGHGFGARHVDEHPITDWPKMCETWMRKNGWLEASGNQE